MSRAEGGAGTAVGHGAQHSLTEKTILTTCLHIACTTTGHGLSSTLHCFTDRSHQSGFFPPPASSISGKRYNFATSRFTWKLREIRVSKLGAPAFSVAL
jgi:hypothetical protein